MLEGHITKKEALERIMEQWHPKNNVETINIKDSNGRILAEDYCAKYSIPVVRAAGMDGIAIKFDNLKSLKKDEEGCLCAEHWVRGVDYDRADTGDDFDDKYDSVLPIEWITIQDTGVKIEMKPLPGPGGRREPEKGMNVRPEGSRLKQGTKVGRKGDLITPLDMASLVSGGYDKVKVIKKPVITFIPTGTELVSAGSVLKRGQCFDSNSVMVGAMLDKLGAEVKIMPVIKDDKDALRKLLNKACDESDIVLINGGSSKGEEDFNIQLLEEEGKLIFHWVKVAPGRPMGASIMKEKIVVNLAGPTLGAYYGILWCVKELIDAWYGTDVVTQNTIGVKVKATLEEDLRTPPLSIIMKMKLEEKKGEYTASPIGMKPGEEQLNANGIYMTDPDGAPLKKGDEITLLKIK